jgi:succinyl-CoA:acetate CoA-transferase
MDRYRSSIILRPQEISNHELIRRLGCLSMNGMIEADIYGNVNSTHVNGTAIMNGIGGPATSPGTPHLLLHDTVDGRGRSRIIPMVTHVDHTEHDVHVIVTEQGSRTCGPGPGSGPNGSSRTART